ncbi:hypothetical protein [Phnomibacter ginsenosidimutans]|uniref:Uncharacterized protein n=1 Tax=Phnomibacter ginsenosidimutans TaxID=2676868 RepID=A0A6I6GSC5_9BACT|nr:hypothetical protein [Phnomibacter ginsenosidimutans]QGW28019.1 hypothetical protein GLV81_07825 [Phnomibacter ginsenosidimutans]
MYREMKDFIKLNLYAMNRFFVSVLTTTLVFLMTSVWGQNCAVNAGLDQTICVNQTLTLTGTPGSPQFVPPAYQWTKLSGPAASITSPTAS